MHRLLELKAKPPWLSSTEDKKGRMIHIIYFILMLKLMELVLLCPSVPSTPTCCLRPSEPPSSSSLFLKTTVNPTRKAAPKGLVSDADLVANHKRAVPRVNNKLQITAPSPIVPLVNMGSDTEQTSVSVCVCSRI